MAGHDKPENVRRRQKNRRERIKAAGIFVNYRRLVTEKEKALLDDFLKKLRAL